MNILTVGGSGGGGSTGDFVIPSLKTSSDVATVGGIFSKLLTYALPIAGILMLFMILAGGYSLILSGGDPEKIKAGSKKVLYGVVGFFLVFAGWWAIKLIQLIFGIQIF
jgi:hypothetical protein